MKKALFIGMCMILLFTLASAQEYEITVLKSQLPYSSAKNLDVLGEINQTADVAYDNWLSGPSQLFFDDPLEQLDVFINIPSSANPGNYTRNLVIKSNASNKTLEFLFIILEQPLTVDGDNDGYFSDADCNDSDSAVNPGSTEIYFNGKDDDCNPSTKDYFELQVSINKNSFALGEMAVLNINALNGSKVSIEICEKGTGFVPCYYPIQLEHVVYPAQETLPFTNISGAYTATVRMSYNKEVQTRQLEFNCQNTISVEMQGNRVLNESEQSNITAAASGGIGDYQYKWILADKSVKTGNQLKTSFSSAGSYAVMLNVLDKYNNELNTTITLQVKKEYAITVLVKDKTTGALITNAVISIEDEDKTTDSSGKSIFHLFADDYNLVITKAGYQHLAEDIEVKEDKTLTYELSPKDTEKPQVTVLEPANAANLNLEEVNLRFNASDDSTLSCSLYLNDGKDSFFSLERTIQVSNSNDNFFAMSLDYGSYQWKVECQDTEKNTGVSETRSFTLTNETKATTVATTKAENPPPQRTNLLDAVYDAQENMQSFNFEQKEAAESLGMDEQYKQAVKLIERTARDLNDLTYRNLPADQMRQESDALNSKLNALYSELPISINVLKTKKFVKYIREDEIKPILEEYYQGSENKVNKELISYITKLQDSITVSTDIKQAEITYLDNSKKQIILVTLSIKYQNYSAMSSDKESLMAVIPADIAGANQVTEVTQGQGADEKTNYLYITYTPEERIVFYLGKDQPLDGLDKINLLLMQKKIPKDMKSVTGAAVFDFSGNFSAKRILIILIIILIPIYLLYAFDGFAKVQELYLKFTLGGVTEMATLLGRAHHHISEKNLEEALNAYREIQQNYAGLSAKEKTRVHSSIVELCKKLDLTGAMLLIDKIEKMIESKEISEAKENYYLLQEAYDKIAFENKAEVYQKIANLAGRLRKAR